MLPKVAAIERELGTRELIFDYVLKNKFIWLFAIANMFVYIARYSMLDWGPTYLREVKGASLEGDMLRGRLQCCRFRLVESGQNGVRRNGY